MLPQRDQARMLVREGSAVLLAGQREEKLLRGDVTDRAEIKGGTDWDAIMTGARELLIEEQSAIKLDCADYRDAEF